MDMIEKLRNEAWDVDGLLTDYIEVHNKIKKEASTFRSLFKKVDFEILFHDAYEVFLMTKSQHEHLLNIKHEIHSQLSSEQQQYLDLLIEYVHALLNTTKILSDNLFRMLEAVEDRKNKKLLWRAFHENQKKYEESISDYLVLGKRLLKKQQIIFQVT